MASYAPQSSAGRPPSGMVGRRPLTNYVPGGGARPPTNYIPGRGATPRPREDMNGRPIPVARNPYRSGGGITPQILAAMARRRLGG